MNQYVWYHRHTYRSIGARYHDQRRLLMGLLWSDRFPWPDTEGMELYLVDGP